MLFPGAKDGNRRCRKVSYVLHLCYIKEKIEPCGACCEMGVWCGDCGGSLNFFFDNYLQTNSFPYGNELNGTEMN